MSQPVSFSCDCGRVQGEADLELGRSIRLLCTCRDCQAYQHHLGRADIDLDENGGSDILQLAPASVTVTQGRDHLKCLTMTEKGVLRWYADCCGAAFVNTQQNQSLAVMGLLSNRVGADATERNKLLGPPDFWVFRKAAKGTPPYRKGMLAYLFKALPMLRHNKKRGLLDSPVFDGGTPISPPYRITEEERQAAYASVDG